MKKLFFTLMLMTTVMIAGCANNNSSVPQSVLTYQKLRLTPEQTVKIQTIREKNLAEIESVKKELEAKRIELLETDKNKNLTDIQKRENFEKYKEVANKLSKTVLEQRNSYDQKFMDVLDDNQKKIYKKYLKQRDKEAKQLSKQKAIQ